MHGVEPQVFLIGETRVVEEGLKDFLTHLGVSEWESDAVSDAEKMVEVMGRLCYKSYTPELNPNVTKVRKSNKSYIENILATKHGSVTEHSVINFIFTDVSRVFTHELVRHRAGVAISQESLRYVRLDDLGQWVPSVIAEDWLASWWFKRTVKQLEKLQIKLAKRFGLDNKGVNFHKKKLVTSAMRRLAPIGLATNIGWSVNIRALRWIIELRTDRAAEEEIRLVFGKVAKIVMERYPYLFGDFKSESVDGLAEYKPQSSKT